MAATTKLKIVLLGEGRVGKTSILLRYIKGEYDERQVSTLQASFLEKTIKVPSSKNNVSLALWDTAGQERFHALGPIYYRDADGAFLVYDVTDVSSFEKVKSWVKELRRIVGEDIVLCIAGNKIDLARNRKVSEEEASKYAKSVGASHVLTSAKLNKGLDDAFTNLATRILKKKKGSASVTTNFSNNLLVASSEENNVAVVDSRKTRGGNRGPTIQIVDDTSSRANSTTGGDGTRSTATDKKKSSCC